MTTQTIAEAVKEAQRHGHEWNMGSYRMTQPVQEALRKAGASMCDGPTWCGMPTVSTSYLSEHLQQLGISRVHCWRSPGPGYWAMRLSTEPPYPDEAVAVRIET